MPKPPAFQMYAADFYMDTADWTMESVGLYTRLLFFQWINGGLPSDEIKLARIAGCGVKKFRHNWKECSTKFIPNGNGKLQNPRLEAEREKQSMYRNKQALRAKDGWETRTATAKPRQSRAICRNDALQSSSSSSNNKDIYTVPDFIPKEPWEAFIEMRKKIGKPLTEYGKKKIVAKIKDLGSDPGALLDQSTMNSWQGIFPLRDAEKKQNYLDTILDATK